MVALIRIVVCLVLVAMAGIVRADESPLLYLEAGVDGKTTLYPGQRTTVFYRYTYRGNIQLDKEIIPLIEAEGFVKIGEKEIRDTTKESVSIRLIAQTIEAKKPGVYRYGPSIIDGIVSPESPEESGKYLTSEVPVVVLTVLPFPRVGQPASFNGAVGNYSFKSQLKGNSEVAIGESLTVELSIGGVGPTRSPPLPDLCCQPGFSGFFQLNDLPPQEVVNGDFKTAEIKLWPLISLISVVPPIEFSYFNPEQEAYVILRSDPIPIRVVPEAMTVAEKASGITDLFQGPLKTEKPIPFDLDHLFQNNHNDALVRAFDAYRSGLSGDSIYKKNALLNNALDQFYHVAGSRGVVYAGLGMTYAQLGQLPWALYYFLQADALLQDRGISMAIQTVREQAGLHQLAPLPLWQKLTNISSKQVFVLQLLFLLSVMGVVVISMLIGRGAGFWKWLKNICWVVLGVIALIFVVLRYTVPIEGILIQAVELRNEKGEFAGQKPISGGTLVVILNITDNGNMVKVRVSPREGTLASNNFGYVPIQSVKSLTQSR